MGGNVAAEFERLVAPLYDEFEHLILPPLVERHQDENGHRRQDRVLEAVEGWLAQLVGGLEDIDEAYSELDVLLRGLWNDLGQ